ncbi:MAG: cupin domain-containing protein [Alphaproteobacteria bacterium]|mgnify:CR=1 FL=1|nr:cupin domain-containing protein [Alphaproteobacteria bacterium]
MARVLVAALGVAMLLAPLGAGGADAPDALSVEWHGKHPCTKLYEDARIVIARCTLAPGEVHVRHSHPGYFGYALSGGTARVEDAQGTREEKIATGDAFDSPAIAWHEVTNIGDTPLTFLIVEKKYQPVGRGAGQ